MDMDYRQGPYPVPDMYRNPNPYGMGFPNYHYYDDHRRHGNGHYFNNFYQIPESLPCEMQMTRTRVEFPDKEEQQATRDSEEKGNHTTKTDIRVLTPDQKKN